MLILLLLAIWTGAPMPQIEAPAPEPAAITTHDRPPQYYSPNGMTFGTQLQRAPAPSVSDTPGPSLWNEPRTQAPSAATPAPTQGTSSLPACVFEDGSGGPLPCKWDAAVMGNGQGRSYVVQSDGTITYEGN